MAADKEPKAPAEPSAPTKRTVLKQEGVLVLPAGVSTEALIAAAKALGVKGAPRELAAWVVVGEFDGDTKEQAIEAHTGKPGTPDAKVGTYKAPTSRAFAGGMRLKAPPKPLVEKESID